jgi:hypothetical protein
MDFNSAGDCLQTGSQLASARAPSPRDSERDLPLPSGYRMGQLVVEYATVCFRSQEDFGPITLGRARTKK